MKVRMDRCEVVLRTMQRWDRRSWFLVSACISVVSILSGIGLLCWVDSTSVLVLLLVSFGTLKTDTLVGRCRSEERDEKSAQMTPERIILTHLKGVLRLGLWTLGAKSVALRLWDRSTGQTLVWNMQRAGEPSGLEVARSDAGRWFQWPDFSAAIYKHKGMAIASLGVGRDGLPICNGKLLDYLRTSQDGSFETLRLGYLEAGRRWHGTVAYTDAPAPARLDVELVKFQEVVRIASSALNSVQMVSDAVRLDERQRLARDLHDGVIQSLIATELQIALVARENTAETKTDEGVLDNVQEMLRIETRKLREQIEELQRGENSESLRGVFERLLKRFERETGIRASLACAMKDDQIAPWLAFDLICLLQEALSNVRKHSGAKHVQVGVNIDQSVYLQVEDDGCGFDLCGRYELATLQSMQRGPRTICERVQANGGDLILESMPGAGVRIEISLPLSSSRETREDGPFVLPRSSAAASRRVPPKKMPRSADGGDSVWRAS